MATLARAAKFGARRGPDLVSLVYVSQRHKSTNITTANYKRGTGGRSSFNGMVATVFGAKSAVGYSLVNRLGKVGTQVICAYRGDPYYMRDFKLMGDLGQILFSEIDLKDEESLRRAMQYSNVVINLIGSEIETRHCSFNDVHVEGPRQIARIAKEFGVERLVHVSALNAGVESNTLIKGGSQFLKSKYEGELAVREEFPEAIIMRPAKFCDLNDKLFSYYTKFPRSHLTYTISELLVRVIPLLKGQDVVVMPVKDNEKLRNCIWTPCNECYEVSIVTGVTHSTFSVDNEITDVAQGITNALKDPDAVGQTYQCVGPYAYKLKHLLSYGSACRGKTLYFSHSYNRILIKARLCEMLYKTLGFPKPRMTMDMLEKESLSENLDPHLPTLEDLGVTAENIEEGLAFINKPFMGGLAGAFHEKTVIPRKVATPPVQFSTSKSSH